MIAFEGLHRHGAEFDPLDGAPGLFIALEDLNAVESRLDELIQETVFNERAADAATPQCRVSLHRLRHIFVAHDIRDDGPSAFAEHAEHFLEQLPFVLRFNEIEHTVRHDDIHGLGFHQRIVDAVVCC